MSTVGLLIAAVSMAALFVSDIRTHTAFWQSPVRTTNEGNN